MRPHIMRLAPLLALTLAVGCKFDDPKSRQSYAPTESFGQPALVDVVLAKGAIDDKTSPDAVGTAFFEQLVAEHQAVYARNGKAINEARRGLYQLTSPGMAAVYRNSSIPDARDCEDEFAVREVIKWWSRQAVLYLDGVEWDTFMVVDHPQSKTQRVASVFCRSHQPMGDLPYNRVAMALTLDHVESRWRVSGVSLVDEKSADHWRGKPAPKQRIIKMTPTTRSVTTRPAKSATTNPSRHVYGESSAAATQPGVKRPKFYGPPRNLAPRQATSIPVEVVPAQPAK